MASNYQPRQNMRQGGDPKADKDKKLFVGGLHHSTNESELKEFYSQWGTITDVVVMRDPSSKKSRGFGFVTFADASAVDAAQDQRPHVIGGKEVDSKRAIPREETSAELRAAVKKIFVGGLNREVKNEDLHEYFSQFGKVVDAQVIMSKERNESRGFAFVTFDDTDAVDKVILSKPHNLKGHMEVRKAVNKEDMRKSQPRTPRYDSRQQNWGNGNGYNQGYDNSYNQGYGPPGYNGYGNGGGYGSQYNYDSAPPQSWGPPPSGDTCFGSYNQQSYGGGPVRGGPPPYSRPAPYAGNGSNTWQQR